MKVFLSGSIFTPALLRSASSVKNRIRRSQTRSSINGSSSSRRNLAISVWVLSALRATSL